MASQGGQFVGFQPNQELLSVLLTLGISRNAASKALFYTGNSNADLAAAWVFENEHRADLNDPLTSNSLEGDESDSIEGEEVLDDSDLSAEFLDPDAFHKMVFVVNTQLNMGLGKVAAQVAHAAIGVYRELCENQDRFSTALSQWEQFGETKKRVEKTECYTFTYLETKIVLKGQNAAQLQELQDKATSLRLASYLVQDAGHTQVEAGSVTVLGIMGKNNEVDQVTGSLSLL